MARRGFDRNSGNEDKSFAGNFASSFGTIWTLKPQAKYLTGARTVLRINGSVVAFAFSISWNARTEATEIYTIDDSLPWEIAPKRIEVSGSLGLFQIPGQSPLASRFQADPASFLMNKYISIEVKDSATDALIFKAPSAMVTGQQGEINSEQMGKTVLTWKAVGWQAEHPPVTPSGVEKDPDDPNASTLSKENIWANVKSKFGGAF